MHKCSNAMILGYGQPNTAIKQQPLLYSGTIELTSQWDYRALGQLPQSPKGVELIDVCSSEETVPENDRNTDASK